MIYNFDLKKIFSEIKTIIRLTDNAKAVVIFICMDMLQLDVLE